MIYNFFNSIAANYIKVEKEYLIIQVVYALLVLGNVFYTTSQYHSILYSLLISFGTVASLIAIVIFNNKVILPKVITARYVMTYIIFLTGLMFLVRYLLVTYFTFENPDIEITIHNKVTGEIQIKNETRGVLKVILIALGATLFFNTSIILIKKILEEKAKHFTSEVERKKAELKLLKTQFSPHFLLNALNNLYSVSKLQPQRTSEQIQKLSSLLKYITYDQTKNKVTLQKEMKFIQDYVYFQLEKGEDQYEVTLDFEEVNPEMLIEPRVLIPFIENAFKHSYSPGKKAHIKMYLSSKYSDIHFVLNNTVSQYQRSTEEDGYFGVGIDSVKLILDTEYENEYTLTINTTDTSYGVDLKINTVHAQT